MRVIGTAGHVDHGKSTLIEALTGTHPDRLKEEQARQMTIDLGFGWLTLPDGQEIGIVDVPGHRDFIENMLAGIAGIDAALLVVAADEGVMPQTKEHLAILDLLQIPAGIIVLTKTDLVTDEDWLEAVESDIQSMVKGTALQDAPVVRVSARTRSGLDDLTAMLSDTLRTQRERPDLGLPRLPIDRVFTMSGFGTVVTGTLSDGRLAVGDEVQFLPSGFAGRVRGLQTHRKSVERAVPGSRTAVNVTGVSADQIRRGEVLTRPGQYEITRRFDAHFHLLNTVPSPLAHNLEVKVFIGTSETTAALRLLGTESLAPGQHGWIQLELHNPLVCVRGDSFILRRPSPGETLGGGKVINPQPQGRHKRFDARVLDSLHSLAEGGPADVLFEAAMALNAAPVKELVRRAQTTAESAGTALQHLIATGKLLLLEDGYPTTDSDLLIIARPHWSELQHKTIQIVASYHEQFPLRGGIPRQELKSRLDLPARLFTAAINRLGAEKTLIDAGNSVALAGHTIRFDEEQQAKVAALMGKFEAGPFSPPGVPQCQAEVGQEIVSALITMGELVAVSSEVAFRKQDYDWMVTKVRAVLEQKGQITLAETRDLFKTSRKYAQALLEYLDGAGITRRSGDLRVLAK
jgi:selenocysteine-specific elongation factor